MRIDISNILNEGLSNLSMWRDRYSRTEYAEKVVLNIFYRKYTIEFMFSQITDCFHDKSTGKTKVKWNDFNDGFAQMKAAYSFTAGSETRPRLMSLLADQEYVVGNITYGHFLPMILESKNQQFEKVEQIEFLYLYYLLTDELILLWAAFGGTGMTQIDSISHMSGVILKDEWIVSYSRIEQILGQLCVLPYLNKKYKASPTFTNL